MPFTRMPLTLATLIALAIAALSPFEAAAQTNNPETGTSPAPDSSKKGEENFGIDVQIEAHQHFHFTKCRDSIPTKSGWHPQHCTQSPWSLFVDAHAGVIERHSRVSIGFGVELEELEGLELTFGVEGWVSSPAALFADLDRDTGAIMAAVEYDRGSWMLFLRLAPTFEFDDGPPRLGWTAQFEFGLTHKPRDERNHWSWLLEGEGIIHPDLEGDPYTALTGPGWTWNRGFSVYALGGLNRHPTMDASFKVEGETDLMFALRLVYRGTEVIRTDKGAYKEPVVETELMQLKFKSGSTTIDPGRLAYLQKVGEQLAWHDDLWETIVVVGIADGASSKTNGELAYMRAQKVRAALIDAGVPVYRIVGEPLVKEDGGINDRAAFVIATSRKPSEVYSIVADVLETPLDEDPTPKGRPRGNDGPSLKPIPPARASPAR